MAFDDTYRESIQTKHISNVGFTSTAKGVTNEGNALKNPHQVLASQIPAVDVVGVHGALVADGITAGLVEKHTIKLTADPTVNGNKPWIATEDNCTETGHAARGSIRVDQWMRYAETQYKLRLFEDTGSNAPDYTAEILPSEASFNWEYDASAGIVYFDDDPSSNGKTTPLWAEVYTYIGDTVQDGLGATASGVAGAVELYEDTNEPSGFINRTSSDISFDDGTRTLTISGTEFSYYIEGTKYTKTGAESVQITDVEGMHYLYYDGATLTHSATFSSDIIYTKAYVSAIYWDAANSTAIHVGDERHGITMDGQTHAYLHSAFGTQYIDGLGLTDLTTNGDGSSNAHATLGVASGNIRDEDLLHNLPTQASAAQLPIYYKEGASGVWRTITANDYPVIDNHSGATKIKWNEWTGSAWQLTEIGDGNYVLSHLFATNDANNPVIVVAGQAGYGDLAAAREGANNEINDLILAGLPFAEFSPIGTLIVQSHPSYTNTPKARIVKDAEGNDYVDWRLSGLSPNPQSVADHANLTGRDNTDSHPATAVSADYTNFDGALSSSDDNVQSALETLDDAIPTLSGALQTQIDSNSTDITNNYNTLDSKIDTTSGTLQTGIDDLSTTVTNNYNTLDGKIDTTSGTLQTSITNNYNTLDTKIDTTSGTLQSEIDSLDSSLTDAIIWEVVDTPFDQIRPKVAHQGKALYTAGNLTIGGNLTVSGTTTTVHSEELTVTDKVITVNNGEAGAGLTGGTQAGIEIDRGSEGNYLFVFDEVQDNFRVGISGSLQAVATREDTPTDNYVAFWNDSETRFDTSGSLDIDDIATENFVTSAVSTASGTLQSQIDTNATDITNNYNTLDGKIDTASGTLQTQIDTNSTNITNNYNTLDGKIDTTSGTLQNAIDTLADAQDEFTELTDTISSYNEGRILFESADAVIDDAALTYVSGTQTLNAPNIAISTDLSVGGDVTVDGSFGFDAGTTINEFVTTVDGSSTDDQVATAKTVYDHVDSVSGTLQTSIDSNATNITNNYNTLDSKIDTTSGTLQTSITNNYNTLDSKIDTTSGTLQSAIDTLADSQNEFVELTDTISSYTEGRILFESADAVIDDGALTYVSGTQTFNAPNVAVSTDLTVGGDVTVDGSFGFDAGTTINEFVTTVDGSSTDDQALTAKGVYDHVDSVSGTLQSSIDTNSTAITNNYNTLDSKIDTTSGTLQSAIDDLDSSLTDDIIWEVVDTPFDQIRPKAAHQGKAMYTAGNLTIGGDLTVSGTTTTIHSEELTVTDKIITTNAGETGAGITGSQYAGIEIDRGSETDYMFVFDEVQDNFRVGISGSLQAVATREDSPTDNYIAVWNDSAVRFDTSASLNINDVATETFVTTAVTTLSGALQTQIDSISSDLSSNYYTKTELDAGQLDNRYYTETELDAGQLDNRYYTETELDAGQLDNRYYTETETDSMLSSLSGTLSSALTAHHDAASTDHDDRYYTETEVDALLAGLTSEFIELTDVEISSYTADRVLFTTASGVTDNSAFTFDSGTGTIGTTAIQLGTGGSVDEIVTTVTSGTTDSQVPTAKAVWDLTEAAASAVHTHYDVDATRVSDTVWSYGSGFTEIPEYLQINVNGLKQRIGASNDCTAAINGGAIEVTFTYSVYAGEWVNFTYIM